MTPDAGIGQSRAFIKVIEQARDLADIPRPVLIRGERGTGKELLARFIHICSSRRKRPYLIVNCGAFQEGLLVSHLFGHERGAFTGADRQRIGLFEKANGGTLFLDEVANLSMTAQARLHRVVEYKTFQRVGGSKSIQVDVRIVAATNADIKALIRKERFMPDLYDRLSFAEMVLPPLRKRTDDIPLLVRHFIAGLHAEIPDLGTAQFTEEAIAALGEYSWPGNVRELKNIVERLYLSDRDRVIRASELPPDVTAREPIRGTFNEQVAAFERSLLLSALRDADGNQREAARSLGMSYDQFRHRFRKHGLGTR